MNNAETQDQIGYYSLDYKYPGLAILIYNFEFARNDLLGNFDKRISEKDIKSFEKLKQFGFQIEPIFLNQTKSEISQLIAKYTSLDYSDYACVFLCMSSHGAQHTFMSTDYNPEPDSDPDPNVNYVEAIEIQEEIIEPFYKVTSLTKKPKILLFDCCRGDMSMSKKIGNKNKNKKMKDFVFADLSNFFTVYSTLENFEAKCNLRRGSYLISTFFEVLEKYGKTHDWNELNIKVNNLMKERHLQIPSFKSSPENKLAFVKKLEKKYPEQEEVF
jgi:hypothetical protein